MINVGDGETSLHYMDYEVNSTRSKYQDFIDITLKGIEIRMEKILTIFTGIDL